MLRRYLLTGIFIIAGVILFTLGIFFVGDRHEAFARHVQLYTEFSDLDGLTKGSQVRVGGMDAGQVVAIQVPASPSSRFRVLMRINEQMHGLVRTDSVVTVDTEGVVGATFLSIHPGSAGASPAPANSTLRSKPAVSTSDLLTRGLGLVDDADKTLMQVGGKIGVALDGVDGAVSNANDVLVGLKEGRGTAGMLLRDENVASQVRQTVSNVQSTSSNLNQASIRVDGLIGDVQKRQLPQKLDYAVTTIDDAVTTIKAASVNVNETIQQVHQTLNQALGPDNQGITAGQNISETLSNANAATGNMSEDTEALKHNVFFKGFFKHRGYYSLSSISPEEYRRDALFRNSSNHRTWLAAAELFRSNADGREELTAPGKRSIDTAITSYGDAVFQHPIVVEGYSEASNSADQLALSYDRALLVRTYLQARFPFESKNLATIPLNSTPPDGVRHDHWDGVCILIASKK